MSESETGQVISSAAEIYEDFFVPALFQEWAGRVVNAAEIDEGQNVLDIACGTGVLSRAAFEKVGSDGSVEAGITNAEIKSVPGKARFPQLNRGFFGRDCLLT